MTKLFKEYDEIIKGRELSNIIEKITDEHQSQNPEQFIIIHITLYYAQIKLLQK